jgi:YgiT-type zinc finger domain-containing protein
MRRSYGYQCEYCTGNVRAKAVQREAFKHKRGFVILEGLVIGICDKCGNRYYSAEILRRVEEIATGKSQPDRIELIPVAQAH